MTMIVRCLLISTFVIVCHSTLWNQNDQDTFEYGGLKKLSDYSESLHNIEKDIGLAFNDVDVNKNVNKWISKMSSPLFHRKKRSANNPTAKVFSLKGTEHNNEAYVHWSGKKNSEVIFVLTREVNLKIGQIVGSTVWSSKDYGVTYQKETFPSNALITFFFVSPANYKNAIFVDYFNKTLYITTDELKTIKNVVVDFEVDKLVLHPTMSNWVLVYSFLSRELRYSKDFGLTWNLLHTGVSPKFYWYIPDVDTDNSTVHLEIYSSNGDSVHYKKCVLDKCSSKDTIDKKLGSFQPISLLIIKQYIFVEKLTQEKSEMYVSYKRQEFKKAHFPPKTLPKNFLIMNADEDQVFVGVTNTDGVTLYLSDTTGQFYVSTLTDLLYVVRGIPLIDFHEVKSLKGIYLANQRSITENSRVRIEVKTLISFDKGGMWNVIPTPVDEMSKCKSASDCSLHLHLDLGSLAAPGILSESKAPGLVLAHGNVGDKLDYNNTNVYVSNNGGVTWKNTGLPSGMYRFNILDQGSILTAVKEATQGLTNIIHYSYDHGSSWQHFTFWENVLQVDGALNEPEINSLSLSIYGHTSGTTAWTLATIKFEPVLSNKCKKEDYEIWMPGDHTQKNCTLGQTLRFERRKQSSKCYIGVDYKPLLNHTVCLCQIEDYECDFGYESTGKNDKCKHSSWFDPTAPSVECVEGKPYNKSVGYRKVASDQCKGGIESSDVYKPVVKNCNVVAPNGLSLYTDSNVISTNTPITIELTQAGGSRISTIYTWNFGDNQTKTITGLEESAEIKHTYKKYGKYNISLTASNVKGKSEAHLFIRVEEKVTLLMLDMPKFTKSKKSTMIEVLTGYSFSPLIKKINHTLFVWTWGDENGGNPELSWLKTIHHTYNISGLYHGSVESLNSVSSVYKQFTIQVFDESSTVRCGLQSRIHRDNFNNNLQIRVSFYNLLKREIMNALGIEDSRLNVQEYKREPFSVDVMLVPGDTGEVKHEDLAKKLIDIVNKGELSVNLDGSKNSLYEVQVKSATLLPDTESPSTDTNTSNSPNLRPVYIAVPVLIVIVVLTALVFLYYRRSYRQAKRYNMLRSHNDEDNAMLGEDEDDDEPPLDLNPDFARDRNYHDDQLDLGSGSHLVMVTGGRTSDEE